MTVNHSGSDYKDTQPVGKKQQQKIAERKKKERETERDIGIAREQKRGRGRACVHNGESVLYDCLAEKVRKKNVDYTYID